MTYATRTTESIQADYKQYTQDDVNDVYESLTELFKRSSVLNNRQEMLDMIYANGHPPHKQIRDMLAISLDWFYYGN